MSRTRHHGDKNKERLFGDSWLWCRGAPKWFSKMTRHKPQRAKRTIALQKLITYDVEDMEEVEFPQDKKPVEYYW